MKLNVKEIKEISKPIAIVKERKITYNDIINKILKAQKDKAIAILKKELKQSQVYYIIRVIKRDYGREVRYLNSSRRYIFWAV